MDAIEANLTRQSVCRYPAGPVPDRLVEQTRRAAMHAPSGGNGVS